MPVVERPHLVRPCELHIAGRNRLLDLLEAAGEGALIERMQWVTLDRHAGIFRAHESIRHALFPLTGVASLVVDTQAGPSLEVGTVGNEGLVGVPLVLGSDRSSTRAFVQIKGEFMRMDAAVFRDSFDCNPVFADATRRYVQAYLAQVTQSCACLRFHEIEPRLARWILMTHDRAGGDSLHLTQEFLALMLGVQRPTVTLAAATLQRAGMIRYHRGVIEVLDRAGLEAAACECYGLVRAEFERLLC